MLSDGCRAVNPRRCLTALVALLALGSAACGPAPTPFPVDIPDEETPPVAAATTAPVDVSPDNTAGDGRPLRYALAPNVAGWLPDLEQIQASAQVEQLTTPVNPDDVGVRYDIIAGYGDLPGGTRGPALTHIALVIAQTPPFDDPAMVTFIDQSLSLLNGTADSDLPGAILEPRAAVARSALRAQIANLGWPDGFDAPLAAAAPGAQWLTAALADLNINLQARTLSDTEVTTSLIAGQTPLALVLWRTSPERQRWETLVGSERVLEVFALPVSYLAAPGLNLTFTAGGWPLADR